MNCHHNRRLFKDNYMRKTEKAQLAKEIRKDCLSAVVPCGTRCGVDGGYLLRAVVWTKGSTYDDVCYQYVNFIGKNFGSSAVVVFDGYVTGASTKDHEHKRRATRCSPDIVVDRLKTAYHDQSSFLCNDANKSEFIALLTEVLQSLSFLVYQAQDDADTMIVKVAMEFALAKEAINVIANDTDVLVMLVYHYKPEMGDIYMTARTSQFVYSVGDLTRSLGSAAQHLLAIHAVSGCDTASSLYGHGKVSVFKKLRVHAEIQSCLAVLECPTSSHEDVMDAGHKVLVLLYGGNATDSLNYLRHSMYMHATATNSRLPQPERLPPTENAARYHLYRVHLQSVQWKLLSTSCMSPLEWGWKLHNGSYIPIATDLAIAPPEILKVSCCKCSMGAKRPCGTRACVCVRYGLSCIAASKSCTGSSCENGRDHDIGDEIETADADVYDVMSDDQLDCIIPWTVEEEV